MPNMSRANNLARSTNAYLNSEEKWRHNRGDVHSLMKRLKRSKREESKKKFIVTASVFSVLIISGIIISF